MKSLCSAWLENGKSPSNEHTIIMFKVSSLSPMIPSRNLTTTRDFFCDVLEFSVMMDMEEYCVVAFGKYEIHLQLALGELSEVSFYMTVDDLDSVWKCFEGKPDGLKIRPPFDQPYGMKELHVVVPETEALMLIGQKTYL